ncbi:phospholipase D-like domain-containing protein [Variovorax sp. RB2P76]|uniref:phospholipase D-like domain-containing protein n=1 Tax=Variovorax sp. RB2P76 TaxID=3443736 RepID=UPI003F479A11
MTLQAMLNEAAQSRSGQQLVCFKEAGLPVYVLQVRVLVKETRPLPPIETAVLRAVRAGLSTPQEIYSFLGLSERAMVPVLAELNKKEFIQYSKAASDAQAILKLTGPGRNAVAEACAVIPVERSIPICWDALTRKVIAVAPEHLNRSRDMTELGRVEVPGARARSLQPSDIALEYLDSIIERHRSASTMKQELVAIKSIERRELRFLDCLMLFFRRTAEPAVVDVAFWREDGASMPHEQAFRQAGGPDRVGARLLAGVDAIPPLSIPALVPEIPGATPPQSAPALEVEPAALAEDTLESLLCHQHPEILRNALKGVRKKLLIISPWIRHHVVDEPFLRDLEAALRRGVKVHIGYGIDEGDQRRPGAPTAAGQNKPAITPQARRALDALAKRFRNFKFVYIGNTHRKLLVCDDEFSVITSFNWLSYRGDPKDKPRDEYGQLVRKRHYVDKHYAEGLALIEHGYQGQEGSESESPVA